ncbi:MAG TPA: Spy/CpxP family protein refolding chaperone [Caulobacteraceae bacterium]|nr:Spy/CpxP family protein refolding chaperone [Caulobacteraceae bacterium]
MNHIFKASAAVAASAALLGLACAALGQDQQPAPRQPPTAEQRAQWRADRQAEHAQRLTALLNLRPDQQPALQSFLAAMAPAQHEHGGPPPGGTQAQLTTPQRLDRMADRMAKHEAQFHQRADAIRSFYSALSPEQQKAFDAMPMLMMGDHQRGGHGEQHGHHDGPEHGPQGDAG